jgi:pimeloyl-ACP methyl ester carboxylesterase
MAMEPLHIMRRRATAGQADFLFAGLYAPARVVAGPTPAAVLFVPPAPQEAMRVHWTSRQLAQAASRAGRFALTFDFLGTGDSAGDPADASLVEWAYDLVRASQELVDRSAAKRLVVLGSRLGATLALRTLEELAAPVERLIAWDPVADGKRYQDALFDLDLRRRELCREPLRLAYGRSGPELFGYAYPETFRQEVDALTLPPLGRGPVVDVIRTADQRDSAVAAWTQSLCAAGVDAKLHDVDDGCGWGGEETYSQTLLPGKLITLVQGWLK